MKVRQFVLALCAISCATFRCIGMTPEAMNLNTMNVEAANLDAMNIEAENLDAMNIEAENLDAMNIEATNLNSMNIDAIKLNAMDKDNGVFIALSEERDKYLNVQPLFDDEAIVKLGLVKVTPSTQIEEGVEELSEFMLPHSKHRFMVLESFINPRPMNEIKAGEITFMTYVVLKDKAWVVGEKDGKILLMTMAASLRYLKGFDSTPSYTELEYHIIVDDKSHKIFDILDKPDGTPTDVSTIDKALQERIVEIQPSTPIYGIAVNMYEAAMGKKW